jgi:hypothetical protein
MSYAATRLPKHRKLAHPVRSQDARHGTSAHHCRFHDITSARRDVQCGGAARTARAACSLCPCPARPHSSAPAVLRTARCSTVKQADTPPARHNSAVRRAARRRGARAARSNPPRLRPARPHNSAPAAPRTVRRHTAKHAGAPSGPHGSVLRRAARRCGANAARCSPPSPLTHAHALPHYCCLALRLLHPSSRTHRP